MSNTLIQLNNCGILRNQKWLVRGVSLKVDRGQIVTLIGPNGSGKSTTAKMALGILRPDEGSNIVLNNLKISYVPQKLSIDWSLPLRVIDFMNLIKKHSQETLMDMLTLTGIKHLLYEDVRNLSGGEFQRLLMARAIAKEPEFLVLDDPFRCRLCWGNCSLSNHSRYSKNFTLWHSSNLPQSPCGNVSNQSCDLSEWPYLLLR